MPAGGRPSASPGESMWHGSASRRVPTSGLAKLEAKNRVAPDVSEEALGVDTRSAPRARVLCVDDEPAVLTILSRALDNRFEIVTLDDPVAALSLLERGVQFSVVISDMRMPQMDGADFLERVKHLSPSSSRLALTGCLDRELGADQVFGILTKPCPIRLLHESVTAAVQHHLLLTRPDSVLSPALPHEINLMSTAPPDHDDMESGIRQQRRGRASALVPPLFSGHGQEFPRLAVRALPTREGGTEAQPASEIRDASAHQAGAAGLAILAAVANKFFLLGQAVEAHRILRGPLEDVLVRARHGILPSPKDAETAAILGSRLAEELRDPGWVEYVFGLYQVLRKPLPAAAIDRVHVALRQVPGVTRAAFREYVAAVRSYPAHSPADQFLIRRLDGLEPLLRG
jgi:CheY-like chemotaxis protein